MEEAEKVGCFYGIFGEKAYHLQIGKSREL